MHPFSEPHCCISLVCSLQQEVQIQRVVIVHMEGMGAASKEVWVLCLSWVGALQSEMEHWICHLHEIFHAAINNQWPRRETYQDFSIWKRNRLTVKGTELPTNPMPAAPGCRWPHILLLRGEFSGLAHYSWQQCHTKGDVVTEGFRAKQYYILAVFLLL